MNLSTTIRALSASILLVSGTATIAQEEDEGYILEITRVAVKMGHGAEFREALKPYHECLIEGEYDGSWSAWRNVDGNPNVYHFVSTMNNWAEMDTPNEVGASCWSEHHKEITSHAESASISFARHLPAWSGDAEDYTVVRLHQFRVDDGGLFGETVGAITSIMKEAEYEHLGDWYEVLGNDSNEPDYFVVSQYANFAAMDEDRAGPYKVVSDAEGEERADELWEQFGDALRDDWEYSSELLQLDPELSHSEDD
ncbi:hypothetical protein [Guyparkeria sp.]|uniref:hypothetical protein n=1 Tax=Guyparkeria sp. TaxID=2035736 RepID=UPI00397101F0